MSAIPLTHAPSSPPPASPLTLSVRCDRHTAVAGETLTFTACLRNTGDRPVTLRFATTRQAFDWRIYRGVTPPTAAERETVRPIGGTLKATFAGQAFTHRVLEPGAAWEDTFQWPSRAGQPAGPVSALASVRANAILGRPNDPRPSGIVAVPSGLAVVTIAVPRGADPAGRPFAHVEAPAAVPLEITHALAVNTYEIHTRSAEDADAIADEARAAGSTAYRFKMAPRRAIVTLTEAMVARLRVDPRVTAIRECAG